MKVQVKTLKGEKHELEVEPQNTVAEIKEKIHTELGLGEPSLQKLIHRGKILKDDQTVEGVGFKEMDFLVLMVRKPKSKPDAPKTSEPASTTASSGTTAPPSGGSGGSGGGAPGDASQLVTGSELETTIQNFLEMGYERDQIIRALRAAYNNPARAAEYLISGIPETVPPSGGGGDGGGGGAAAADTGASGGGGGAPPSGGGGGGGGGAPAMADMQRLLASNPQMLAGLVAQLAQNNPRLLAAMQQNPQALAQVLSDPNVLQQLMGMMLLQQMQQAGDGDGAGGGGGAGGMGGFPGMGGGGMAPPGTIRVTAEEKAAIDNLKALGFSESQAVEAYMVCDKNEDMAANYLLENAMGGWAAPMDVDTPSEMAQVPQAPGGGAEPGPPSSGGDAPPSGGSGDDSGPPDDKTDADGDTDMPDKS